MTIRLTFFLFSFICMVQCNASEGYSGDMGVYTANYNSHFEASTINSGIDSRLLSSPVNPVVNFSPDLIASNQTFDFPSINDSSLEKKNASAERWENSFRYSFMFFSIILSLYVALKIT